jgi:Ring finger domain
MSCPQCNEVFIEEIRDDMHFPPHSEVNSMLEGIRPIVLIPRQSSRSNPAIRDQAERTAAHGRSRNRHAPYEFSTRLLSFTIDNVMTALVNARSSPRMTDLQLQEIPKITIAQEQVQAQIKCAICFDDFKLNETDIRNLQCNHIFHEKCIFPWLRSNATCPVCRFRMPNANDDEDSDELGDIAHFGEYVYLQILMNINMLRIVFK